MNECWMGSVVFPLFTTMLLPHSRLLCSFQCSRKCIGYMIQCLVIGKWVSDLPGGLGLLWHYTPVPPISAFRSTWLNTITCKKSLCLIAEVHTNACVTLKRKLEGKTYQSSVVMTNLISIQGTLFGQRWYDKNLGQRVTLQIGKVEAD